MSWRVTGGGDARVTQESGNIFYRVEPGGPFIVSTPQGTVRVLGTCFRVEVKPMKSARGTIAGAIAGAGVATVVLVSVYEGRVMSSTSDNAAKIVVPAGKVALMQREGPPAIVGDLTGAPETPEAQASGPAGRLRGAGTIASPAESIAQQNRSLTKRAKELESEVVQLHAKLKESGANEKNHKILDMSQEEKVALAKRCELRWDTPFRGTDAPAISSADREKIGLTADEADLVNKVLSNQHRALLAQLRKLYIEVTGDPSGVESLSPTSMISEINDKSLRPNIKAVYQRLARERAAIQTPPNGTAGQSPIERLMRLLTTSGDRVEKAIGQKIGPDLARRHRELHGGYGSKSRSRYGCPGGGR